MNDLNLDTLRNRPDVLEALIARARHERSAAVARIAASIVSGLKARFTPAERLGRTLARIG